MQNSVFINITSRIAISHFKFVNLPPSILKDFLKEWSLIGHLRITQVCWNSVLKTANSAFSVFFWSSWKTHMSAYPAPIHKLFYSMHLHAWHFHNIHVRSEQTHVPDWLIRHSTRLFIHLLYDQLPMLDHLHVHRLVDGVNGSSWMFQ